MRSLKPKFKFSAPAELVAFVVVGVQLGSPLNVLAQDKTTLGEPAPVGTLSLEAYLDQVRLGNKAFISSRKFEEGAELRSDEWKLLTRPRLIAATRYSDDQSEPQSAFQGSETEVLSYSLGVSQTTNFGLQASLVYQYADTSITGLAPEAVGLLPSDTTLAGPVLELRQSLWSNGFGRQIQARQEATEAEALGAKFTQSFQQTQLLAGAENAYWALALAREAVQATRENLERAQRMQSLNAQRLRLQLVDRSDLLQATAAVQARTLEYETALDDERRAERAFNTARGLSSSTVAERLISLEKNMIERLKIPERVEFRDDVKAAEQNMRASRAGSIAQSETLKPTLDIVGSLGLNGYDQQSSSTAVSESFSTDYPEYRVALEFQAPLDFTTLRRSREGYQVQAAAAEVAFQRQIFEQERLWINLVSAFEDAVKQYKLALTMEDAQREKLNYERTRHSRGRTTVFQVIQFEQDFANAQLARIRSQANVLNAYAQIKTFGGGQ